MKNEDVFVGIDISKKTLDVCLIKETNKREVFQIPNTNAAINKFLKKLTASNGSCEIYLCIENTGKFGWAIMENAVNFKLNFFVVNPLHLKRSLGLIRGKNDRVDAIRIAQFIKKNYPELNTYTQERKEIITMKVLLSERRFRVANRKKLRVKNKDIKVLNNKSLANQIIRSNNQIIDKLTAQIAKLEEEIRIITKQDQELHELVSILTSIPGVGEILAWNLIVKTNEFKSITEPRKLACYSGVAPFQNRSGTSVFGKTRVSLMADKQLKKTLHLGAMRAVRMENDLKKYYNRKVEEGKNKMAVLNAVRNKIIHIAFALIKNREMFQNRLVLS